MSVSCWTPNTPSIRSVGVTEVLVFFKSKNPSLKFGLSMIVICAIKCDHMVVTAHNPDRLLWLPLNLKLGISLGLDENSLFSFFFLVFQFG